METSQIEMNFSVSRDYGLFEWAGTNLDAVFCQRGNIFSPSMWRMMFDIVRFNQFALDLLVEAEDDRVDEDLNRVADFDGSSSTENLLRTRRRNEETIGQYLEREGYSDVFRDDYLIPMTAAVWSTSPDKCALDFPAATLVRFL